MPWLKSGDTSASYPRTLAIDELPDAEDWSVNEVSGFIRRLFEHSAAHMTDYVVGFGDVKMFGGGRHELLVNQAASVGLMRLVAGEGRTRRWELIKDPEFLHMRLRDEVMWDRQRDADRRNKDLTMPVRLRDGDACRYCNKVVNWADHKSARGGTYDHRDPGQAATLDTYVVACRACNSARTNDEHADDNHPLLPAPQIPHYSKTTRKLLEAFFGPERVAARLGEASAPDTADATVSDPQAPQTDNAGPDGQRPVTNAPSAPQDADQQPQPTRDPEPIPGQQGGTRVGSGRVGPGLEGTGQVGSGQDGTGRDGSPTRRRPRRRARRGKKPPPPREGT